MPVSFSDLQLAFEFVSGGGMGENEAYLDRQSGKIYRHSEFDDNDEELPGDKASPNTPRRLTLISPYAIAGPRLRPDLFSGSGVTRIGPARLLGSRPSAVTVAGLSCPVACTPRPC